jgi:hypothetical protein
MMVGMGRVGGASGLRCTDFRIRVVVECGIHGKSDRLDLVP